MYKPTFSVIHLTHSHYEVVDVAHFDDFENHQIPSHIGPHKLRLLCFSLFIQTQLEKSVCMGAML